MKKRTILLLAISILIISLSGCSSTELNVQVEGEITTANGFIKICDKPLNLVYDSMTHIVYLRSENTYGSSYSAYIAPNGLPYRFNSNTNSFEVISK